MSDENGTTNGGQTPEWTETLPQDIRDWDEVKNSDSPEKFWDQMVNMRSRMGSSIRIPGADAGDEDRSAFHAKLKEKVPGLMSAPDFENEETLSDLYERMGRPKEAKDYKIPELKDSKDQPLKGMDLSVLEAFKDQAHKAGLSQKQFTDAVMSFVQPNVIKYEQALEKNSAEKAAIAEEWGTAYERNSKVVENFLSHTDAPEGLSKAIQGGTIDKTSMMWLHKLATQSVKGDSDFQTDESNRHVMTPDEASMKISEIRGNSKHAYNNKRDPGHKSALKHVRELYLIKNPKSGNQPAPGTGFPVGGIL